MKAATGITLSWGLKTAQQTRAFSAQSRALEYFPWLKKKSLELGPYSIHLWGHGEPQEWSHESDSQLWILVGCPDGEASLAQVAGEIERHGDRETYLPPWEGSYLLLRIDARNETVSTWNDWVGTYPAFHSQKAGSGILSTLEPVVQQGHDYGPEDIDPPALACLLLHGHFLDDWTLYSGMKSLLADSFTEWSKDSYTTSCQWKTRPSDSRWNRSWDSLSEEMFSLTREAVHRTLKEENQWCLPLSGGMDSRLFAAIGAEAGANLKAYAYGPDHWSETIYSRQVAQALEIPWKRIELGPDFLRQYTPQWADWFGSSVHFHGMYQLPFLEFLKQERPGQVLLGHMGDTLAGNHLLPMEVGFRESQGLTPFLHLRPQWSPEELTQLVRQDLSEALATVRDTVQRLLDQVDGTPYQKLAYLNFWNRQRLFISYQPILYQYYRGVRLPYMSRDYANFCQSLPRLALERRMLQFQMVRDHFPKLAGLGGTFTDEPLKVTGYYALKRKFAHTLPRGLRKGSLQEFNPSPNPLETRCIAADPLGSTWPLQDKRGSLESWISLPLLDQTLEAARNGSVHAVNKLQPLQTLAYRL